MFSYFPFLIPALCAIGASPVHAYVDPGSGSMAVQAILAGFLGVLLAVKIYWKKLGNFFRNLFRSGGKNESEDQP
jgi:hypothetical protein